VPIISTIQQRKYVKLENRRFVPLELGETVNRLMKQHFPKIVDVLFTAQVESGLDQVEEGEQEWTELLHSFYGDFKSTLSQAEQEMERVERPVVEIGEACPLDGSPLVIKTGRYGEFISCSNYPECTYSRQLQKKVGVACPRCGNDIVERKSKRGKIFYGCGAYPACDYALWDKPVPEPCPQCNGLVVLTSRGKPVLRCKECGHEQSPNEAPRELVSAR
jgi:DNA topoisomerase-1